MPKLGWGENSIQMVPICADGLGLEFVGNGVYFWIMASVGLNWVDILLRLFQLSALFGHGRGTSCGKDLLRRAARVCKPRSEFI